MSKLSELIRKIQRAGKLHTRLVLAGKDAGSVKKKWATLALKAARKAEMPLDLIKISQAAPSGSEAEELADSKFKEMKKGWGGGDRVDARVFELSRNP